MQASSFQQHCSEEDFLSRNSVKHLSVKHLSTNWVFFLSMSNYKKMCHQSALFQQIDRCLAGGKTKNIRKGMTRSLRNETLAQAILLRQWRGKKTIYSFFMHFHPSVIPSLQHLLKVCPGEERFPRTTAPPFSPAGTSAMRMGWCPRTGGGKLVPQGGFHGPCSEEQERLGQAMGPMGCCMWSSGPWGIGVSIRRSVCEKVQTGVPTHCVEEGRKILDTRSPWVSCLVLFPGPNHGSLTNPGGDYNPEPLGCSHCSQASLHKYNPKGFQSGCQ